MSTSESWPAFYAPCGERMTSRSRVGEWSADPPPGTAGMCGRREEIALNRSFYR